MVFQVVKEVLAELMPARPRRIVLHGLFFTEARDFRHCVIRRQQNRAQGRPLVAVKGLIAQRNAEEPGKPECFIRTLRLDVAPERFGPHVDTQYQLRARAHVQRRHGAPVRRESLDDPDPEGVLIGLKPHRAVPVRGKGVQPAQ